MLGKKGGVSPEFKSGLSQSKAELQTNVEELKARLDELRSINKCLDHQITEYRQAEETLWESKACHRYIFETMTDGFAICEIICDDTGKPYDFRYLAINREFEHHTGLKSENIIGRTVRELFQYSEPIWLDRYGKVAITGEPASFEAWFGPLNRWYEVYAFKTEPLRFGVIFRDITGHKAELQTAYRSLDEKSRYIEAFFNHTITPLVLLDRDFNFIRVNQAYAKACEKEVDEFPGHNHFEFYPSDAKAIFEEVVCTRQPFQVIARPFVFPDHPDWGVTYWNWTLTPLLDVNGEVEALVFALEDVTGPKRTEIELEDHRDKLQELVRDRTRDLDATRDRLAADLAGMTRLQEISTRLVGQDNMGSLLGEIIEAAIEITYADKGDIQLVDGRGELNIVEARGFDRPFLDFFNSVNESQAACGTAMARCERIIVEDVTKSPIFVGQPSLEVLLAAGVRAVQSTPLISRSGLILGVFSTHYQVSHRPEERELMLLDMLARQAADMIERIRAANELKEAKMQAELYLDLMSHDISNMHQIAMGQLELVQEKISEEGGLSRNDKEMLDASILSLKRSARLIDNVRKLQKIKSGEYKTEAFDVCKVVSEVIEEHSNIPGKDVSFNYAHINDCYVNANPLLKDVFSNIVGNAIKHSNSPQKISIDVNRITEKGKAYCLVSIEDNGPGIPDESKKVVFNRLKRGQSIARGNGLGLYIVKTLVDSFGGQVKIKDRVFGDHTKGSIFVVYLPISQ